MLNITIAELRNGCEAFWDYERRDAMYRVATKLVKADWPNPAEVADGLGVVLLTWNNAAYRYGSFDFADLERFIRRNRDDLASFRSREIAQFDLQGDAASVRRIFVEALNALAYTEKKIKTPVGVAKALHILAPGFFPLWDREIARACQHLWDTPAGEKSADAYLSFINLMQDTVAALEKQFAVGGPTRRGLPAAASLGDALSAHGGQSKTMLKFVDEYLYAKYTKKLLDS
jgi:hypothetical protein